MSTEIRVHDVVRVGRGSTDWVVQGLGRYCIRARTARGASRGLGYQDVRVVGHIDAETRVVTYSTGALRAWPGNVPAAWLEPIQHLRNGAITRGDELLMTSDNSLDVIVQWDRPDDVDDHDVVTLKQMRNRGQDYRTWLVLGVDGVHGRGSVWLDGERVQELILALVQHARWVGRSEPDRHRYDDGVQRHT